MERETSSVRLANLYFPLFLADIWVFDAFFSIDSASKKVCYNRHKKRPQNGLTKRPRRRNPHPQAKKNELTVCAFSFLAKERA